MGREFSGFNPYLIALLIFWVVSMCGGRRRDPSRTLRLRYGSYLRRNDNPLTSKNRTDKAL